MKLLKDGVVQIPKFKLLVLSLLLISCCIGMFWFFLEHTDQAKLAESESGEGLALAQTTSSDSTSPYAASVALPLVKKNGDALRGFMGTPAETAEVKKWFAQHGELFSEEDLEYQSYDESTLRQLGNDGDIRALHRLAKMCVDKDHYMLEGYGGAVAEEYLWRAAVLGSSKALADLALMHDARVFGTPGISATEKRLAVIEVLARYDAASYRGNRYPNINDASVFKETYQINLSTEEQLKVNNRAQEIYDSLSKRRSELGLDEFDNSVPDSVEKFFEVQESIFKENL